MSDDGEQDEDEAVRARGLEWVASVIGLGCRAVRDRGGLAEGAGGAGFVTTFLLPLK